MERKTFNLIETKADDEGNFTALASVFGNVDSVGDRMLPGSFQKTLEAWRKSGDPIPVILSHNWADPFAMVGKADPRAVYEDDRGLVVQGTLDLENEVARQVHKLMKDRLLKGWSFGYTVPKGGQRQRNGANEVSEVDLVEVGPTLKGANSEARLESIKSALHKETEAPPRPVEAPETPEEDAPAEETPPSPEPVPPPDDEPTPEEASAPALALSDEQMDDLAARIAKLVEPSLSTAEPKASNPSRVRARDSLRRRSLDAALEIQSDGWSNAEPPPQPPPEQKPDLPDQGSLRRQSREALMSVLTD